MIRVCVVDDEALIRAGLAELVRLAPDLEVAGLAADGEEALRLIRERDPDVALIDVRMPEMSGLELLRELKAAGLRAAPIILTTFDDDAALAEALAAGARGFLLKDTPLRDLHGAIREVAAGGTASRPGVTGRVVTALRDLRGSGVEAGPDPGLTVREVEVLRLMAAGLSNREIAGAIGNAEGTVKNQVSSILAKLGVRDRTRAVLLALDRGYI